MRPDEIRYNAQLELEGRITFGAYSDQLSHSAAIATPLQAISDPIDRARHTVAVFGTEPEDVGPDEWLAAVAAGGRDD